MAYLYNDIIKNFNNNEWDFSYLNFEEIWEVINQPIKYDNIIHSLMFNGIPFNKNNIFLVIIKKTKNFDYTFLTQFDKIKNEYFPELNYKPFWCNYKYAAVKAGLGQFAKNSLFYHPVFQFETHISVICIEDEVYGLPQRKQPNFKLLKLCEGCLDCYNACPVKAIHNQNEYNVWIDTYKCDNFCHFGNHMEIPSIKWNWLFMDEDVKDYFQNNKEIFSISNYFELQNFCKKTSCQYITYDGVQYEAIFPICRECTSQPKCSKYNGKYPYNWNDVILTERKIDFNDARKI